MKFFIIGATVFKYKIRKLEILFILLYPLYSFSQKDYYEQSQKVFIEYNTNIENLLNNNDSQSVWFNQYTFFNDTLDNYCSRIYNKSPYGIGAKFTIPENLCDSNFILGISAEIKKQNDSPSFTLVAQLEYQDSVIYWNGIKLNGKIQKTGYWQNISEEIKFPKNFSKKNTKITLYFLNTDSSFTYIDNIKIQLKSLYIPSYLPEISFQGMNDISKYKMIYQNKFYRININEQGKLIILDKNNEIIFNQISYFFKWKKFDDEQISTYSNPLFKLISIKKNQLKLESINSKCKLEIEIDLVDTLASIEFKTKTTFSDSIRLLREAIVFDFIPEIKEVYRKNRQLENKNFQKEYWLDKQGLKIGKNENSCYIYNPENISSLQLDSKNKRIIVNLDYSADHPLLHYPLKDSSLNYYEDISPIIYLKNESRENKFSFTIGIDNDFFPRIMKNPDGFLSTYVFTEHADWTDIQTQRATYFGDSRIIKSADATGGFIKYNIPVTKSVFYTNPDNIMNDDKRFKTSFQSPIVSIKNTPEFFEFLSDIKNYNIDICLHTPEQYTTNKKTLLEAASYMNLNFQSPCWIDHGYDNGIKNNREDIVCDGLIKNSKYYSLDILKKNGIKYFWNCYFEEVPDYSKFNFYSFIGSPYICFGDAFPTPEYWEHSSLVPNVYFWKTTSLLNPGNNWNYFFSKQRLDDFANNYQVEFNHCYPASIDINNGFWIFGNDNNIIVNPNFDNFLKTLNEYRNEGLINITTVKEILNYWTSLENVTITNIEKNKFIISNNSNKDIKGLSLAVNTDSINVNGEEPMHKFYIRDLIFWFDLHAGEKKIITK